MAQPLLGAAMKIRVAKTSDWGDWEAWSEACGWSICTGDWEMAYEAAVGHACMCGGHK